MDNKLVVFDCDGTLVDSQHLIFDAMALCFERAGLPPPEKIDVRDIIGLSVPEAIDALAPYLDKPQQLELVEDYKMAFQDILNKQNHAPEPLYDGIIEILRTLDKAGYMLAIATGKSTRGLKRLLNSHNITDLFISLQTADNHPSKPHPSMMLTAMSDAGASPRTTVIVGDTSFDMQMGRDSQSFAIGVNWGYHGCVRLKEAGAHTVVDSVKELPVKVKELIG